MLQIFFIGSVNAFIKLSVLGIFTSFKTSSFFSFTIAFSPEYAISTVSTSLFSTSAIHFNNAFQIHQWSLRNPVILIKYQTFEMIFH